MEVICNRNQMGRCPPKGLPLGFIHDLSLAEYKSSRACFVAEEVPLAAQAWQQRHPCVDVLMQAPSFAQM